jgi:hypothetical protein
MSNRKCKGSLLSVLQMGGPIVAGCCFTVPSKIGTTESRALFLLMLLYGQNSLRCERVPGAILLKIKFTRSLPTIQLASLEKASYFIYPWDLFLRSSYTSLFLLPALLSVTYSYEDVLDPIFRDHLLPVK